MLAGVLWQHQHPVLVANQVLLALLQQVAGINGGIDDGVAPGHQQVVVGMAVHCGQPGFLVQHQQLEGVVIELRLLFLVVVQLYVLVQLGDQGDLVLDGLDQQGEQLLPVVVGQLVPELLDLGHQRADPVLQLQEVLVGVEVLVLVDDAHVEGLGRLLLQVAPVLLPVVVHQELLSQGHGFQLGQLHVALEVRLL